MNEKIVKKTKNHHIIISGQNYFLMIKYDLRLLVF